MAEFKEVCKQWRRMCEAANECGGNCVALCALAHNEFCGNLIQATDKDIENAETVIMEWAKKNPEPVYPTWIDWLMSEGVIPTNYMAANSTDSEVRAGTFYVTIKAFKPIPDDIAEKLGIAPKE